MSVTALPLATGIRPSTLEDIPVFSSVADIGGGSSRTGVGAPARDLGSAATSCRIALALALALALVFVLSFSYALSLALVLRSILDWHD